MAPPPLLVPTTLSSVSPSWLWLSLGEAFVGMKACSGCDELGRSQLGIPCWLCPSRVSCPPPSLRVPLWVLGVPQCSPITAPFPWGCAVEGVLARVTWAVLPSLGA